MPIFYSPSEIEFLRQLRFAGGKYTDFAKILQENHEIETNLLSVANSVFAARLKEPVTSAAVALSMIGFLSSRNFLAASMIRRNDKDLIPDDPSVSRTLHYALAGESIYGIEGMLSADYFVAGLVFDILVSILTQPTEEGIKIERPLFVDELWKHGLQVANIACQLARGLLPDLNLEKDLCVDGILHDIGKFVIYSDKDAFTLEQIKREKTLPDQMWMREVEEEGMPHDTFGHFILWNLGFLSDSSWVVMYHHQPFLASRLGSTAYMRATLIWLADHISRNREYHHRPRVSERILSNWYEASSPALGRCTEERFKNVLLGITF